MEFTDSSLTEEQYNAIWSDNPEKVVFRITLAVGSGYSYLNFEFKYSGTHYARNYICPALNNAIKVSLGELYTLGTLAIQITPDQTSKYKCTTALAHVADIYESYKFPTGNYNKGLVDFTIAASKAGAEQYGYDTTLLTRKAVKEYLADSSMPAAPTSDGNYVLKCSIVDGVATYNWVAE